jgi:oxygen-dependent protoporphyrinogen oxidase
MYADPGAKSRYLVRGGKLVRLPDSLAGFVRTPLFSARTKLRLLAEPFIKPASRDGDESVEQFVLRRLGREFLDYAINPLVGGVYAGDPAKLSVRHAFPKLHALEQRYHSLILGQVLGARERRRREETSKQSAPKFSFDKGLQVLTDELCHQLGNAVRFGTHVVRICRMSDGWQIFGGPSGKETLGEFGTVLFAGTARALARLQVDADLAPDLSPLAAIPSPPIASVVLAFRRADVAHPLDGFGVLVPEVENLNILGTIFSSTLFPKRTPAGHVMLTTYLGGTRQPDLALLNPERQVIMVLRDLEKLLGVRGQPVFEHHHCFPKSIPQYEVGYGRFKYLLDEAESKCPGLFFAGQYRDGISLGDCIVSGHNSADRIQAWLGAQFRQNDFNQWEAAA